MVDEHHFDLAAIVGVDRARRIEHRDAVLGRETRAGPDLRLVALRAARWRSRVGTIARVPGAIVSISSDAERGGEVHSRRARCLLSWELESPAVIEPARKRCRPVPSWLSWSLTDARRARRGSSTVPLIRSRNGITISADMPSPTSSYWSR